MTASNSVMAIPTELECLTDAPNPYRAVMHFTHFLTIPLYMLAIYALVHKCPRILREYRNYLLWHTIGNILFEIYISIFMLPVTYLPYPVFRGSGVLKYFNVSGLIQFYLLVVIMIHTGLSILEMFKYRFNAAISNDTLSKKILHKIAIFFWVIVIIIPMFCFATLPRCHPKQEHYKQVLYDENKNNGISIQVLCNTVVTAPPLLDPVFTPLMILMTIAMLTAGTIIPQTFLSIWTKLEELSRHLSKRTIQLQKMLLISLFIQAVIHGVMLGAPLIGFVYAIVFVLPDDNIAYVLLVLVSFHGSMSTFAMIGFTKPIRLRVFSLFFSCFPFLIKPKSSIGMMTVTEIVSFVN
uniref:Serpentine Receptor, class H n=1 Tax=Caenorhabditis japonica TaxID=281687 RepID=A0A8R1HRD3_CAEJA